jgi:UDP-N-acetylglucosamine 3-dehydrogenase
MVNLAVIGVGSMGKNHARVLFNLEHVDLRAVCDNSAEQAEKIGMKYNCRWYTSYQDMLDREDIDAVCIAVPTRFHKECALYVMSKGKHVLVEKPIASTIEEAKEVIAAAKQYGVHLMVGHIERFNPAVLELKRRLDSGELGEIYKVDVQRIGPFPQRITDVGVIVDLSVHDIDVIHYLLKSPVKHVYAEKQQRIHAEHEDSVTALLTYYNGMLGILNVNYLSPTKIRQLSIFGKKGMFQINYLSQELYFYENSSFTQDDWSVTEGDMRKINVKRKESLQTEIEHFIDVIEDKTHPLVNGEDALYALQIAHDILESAQKKGVVLR